MIVHRKEVLPLKVPFTAPELFWGVGVSLNKWSANFAMCHTRHARSGTKESTRIGQPCRQLLAWVRGTSTETYVNEDEDSRETLL